MIRRWSPVLLAWRGRIRVSEEVSHLTLAGGVGVIGGVTNLVFIFFVDWFGAWIWSLPADGAGWARSGGVLALTVVGGLVAGWILHVGLHYLGRQGTSNFLEAVLLGDGRLPFRTALVKGLSSWVSIVSGASIGREGSITQLTATFASKWGQLFGWPPYRLRLLVACGAASGMAAAYNAPIAGAVFAAQIVLGNFAMNLFAPLVFASVVATMVSRNFLGGDPLYDVPEIVMNNHELVWFLILGGLCGVSAAVFQKALGWAEKWVRRLCMPIYLRLAMGGLIVGLLALVFPGVIGNGYREASGVLHGEWGGPELLGLTFARFVATVAVVALGTLGGIFTPSLFLGAAIGGLFYHGLGAVSGGSQLPIGAYALVGMGAMLAGTTHAPLLAMIMIFELTLNYSLMPPLMLTCVISTLLARALNSTNVYSEGLELKGLAASWESERLGTASRRRIGDLMLAPTPPLAEADSFDTIAERFIRSTYHFLPVVNGQGCLMGIVALQDLKEYLTMGDHLKSVIALDVMRPPPRVLTPDQRLDEALTVLLASEMRNVPVVNRLSEMKFIGVVVRSEALGLLSEAIATKIPGSGTQND